MHFYAFIVSTPKKNVFVLTYITGAVNGQPLIKDIAVFLCSPFSKFCNLFTHTSFLLIIPILSDNIYSALIAPIS